MSKRNIFKVPGLGFFSMERRVYTLIALSILILIGLIEIADLGELLSILKGADLILVLLSITSYTLAIVVFAVIWHLLLKTTGLRLGLVNNLKLVFSAVFFNVVTPTASYGGEAVRAYLLSEKYNQDAGRGIATIVAHRIIGTISNSLGTFALGVYIILVYNVKTILIGIIGVVTITSFFGFLVFLYFGLRIDWSKKVVNKFFRFLSRFRSIKSETKRNVDSTLESYHEGLEILLSDKPTLLISLFLGFVTWFFVNLVAVFSYQSVGGLINTENFLLIFTLFSVSRLIPTGLPEFVGSKETILAGLISASGLPTSTSVAVIILIRVATQAWMIVLGGAITLEIGVEGFKKRV
jgi:uncharacterized protein (TIRG00374 family)